MTLEEFKEYAKTVTREEFLSNNANKFDYTFQPKDLGRFECPDDYNLPVLSCGRSCKDCWIEAVKDIKFKDDIEKDSTLFISTNGIYLDGNPIIDNVNHPNHYTQGKYEVIDYIEDKLSKEELQGYCVGNVLKYVSRFKHKNRLEDLKKAEWYLNRLIKNMEGKDEEKR